MKLLIAGSRSVTKLELEKYLPENVDCIITGGAAGVDTIAEKYADERGIFKIIIKPEYRLYGRAAPLMRNIAMVDMCDTVMAFWDGISKGTKHTIDYAKSSGKEVMVFIIK